MLPRYLDKSEFPNQGLANGAQTLPKEIYMPKSRFIAAACLCFSLLAGVSSVYADEIHKEQMERRREACNDDAKLLCPGQTSHGETYWECLKNHYAELNENCKCLVKPWKCNKKGHKHRDKDGKAKDVR